MIKNNKLIFTVIILSLLTSCKVGTNTTTPSENTKYIPSGSYTLTETLNSGQPSNCGQSGGSVVYNLVSNGTGALSNNNLNININLDNTPSCGGYTGAIGNTTENVIYNNCNYNSSTFVFTANGNKVFTSPNTAPISCNISVNIKPNGGK
jgi:hypothetical protein